MRTLGIHGSPLLIGVAGIAAIAIGLARGRPEVLAIGAVILVLGLIRSITGR